MPPYNFKRSIYHTEWVFKLAHPAFKQSTLNNEHICNSIHKQFKALILPHFYGIKFNFYINLMSKNLLCKYT